MASLRRKAASRFWWACFTLPDGQRAQRSTKEIDRKRAQKLADTFEQAARAKATARQAQRVISDIYARVTGERLPAATVRAFLDSWLVRKKPETAAGTFAFYHGKTRAFLAFLGERADEEIERLGTPDILAFRKAEAERVSPTTVNHAIKLLRMVFEQAKRDGLIVDNPAENVAVLKKREGSVRRPFTLPELGGLLGVADPEWRSLLLFGFYTGQRLGDLARMTWANVDLERDELRFTMGKTGRRQILPLAPPLRRYLLENAAASDAPKAPLHPRAFAIVMREGKSGTLSRQFGELMATAGLVAAKSHKKSSPKGEEAPGRSGRRQVSEISFHALRHTATSLMKNAGISSSIVQEFIGHESEAINRVYTHIETASLRRAADALPDIFTP